MVSSDPYFKLRPPQPTSEDEICKCEDVKPVKLMQALGYNPLHCIDCNLEVLPESLELSESLAEDIAEWAQLYQAIDTLWLDSGPYESWAKDQLSDIESPVNQRGLDVRKKLEGIRPCYYWYFQDESADDFEAATICPSCRRPLTPYLQGIFPQLICQSCKIIMFGQRRSTNSISTGSRKNPWRRLCQHRRHVACPDAKRRSASPQWMNA